jgi:hypothetical protein
MNQLANFLPVYSSCIDLANSNPDHGVVEREVIFRHEFSKQDEVVVQEAYERGKADAELEQTLANAAKVEQIYKDFAEQISVEKQRWIETEVSKISIEFNRALDRVKFELSDLMCRAVQPFLKENIVAATLHETKVLLLGALNERENVRVKISGPETWVNAFKASMEMHPVEFVCLEKPEMEVHLSCDHFTITSQINSWLKCIEEFEIR